MRNQSLASIVNNPKKESIFKRVKTLVSHKVTGKGVPFFKVLTEHQIEESSQIPRVNPAKDFKDYFKKLQDAEIDIYF